MNQITIRFRYHPKTGKRQMVVHYESDEELLPHEHERDHRALVESLIGRPLGDDEEIVVERAEKGAGAAVAGQTEGARAPQKSGSGS